MPASSIQDVPNGGELNGVDFVLKDLWDLEDSPENLDANDGWEWGSDGVAGAHSGTGVWGTRLGRDYANCADYRLDLPLDLTFFEAARLRFWHWYDIESTYDGGNIQVSTDGGEGWNLVVVDGGYPDFMRGSCNPLRDQPGFGGVSDGWEEVAVDLADYAGEAILLRFWFGSDGGVRERGWYLDDLSLEGTMASLEVVHDLPSRVPLLEGLMARPNPTAALSRIEFTLGAPAPTWLTVYDAAGRMVRRLLEDQMLGPGRHHYRWDGQDDSGYRVAAGVYWARVFANGRSLRRQVTILR
jgi:hypothetical protein